MNDIIISGKAASGKTFIAKAIAATHEKHLHLNFSQLSDKASLEDMIRYLESLLANKITLVVIEEGSIERIENFYRMMNLARTQLNARPGAYKFIPFVFTLWGKFVHDQALAQERPTLYQMLQSRVILIHANHS
jgi:hypothetical protein